MEDAEFKRRPKAASDILAETDAMGFGMASEPKVGAFLAALAASKPGGRVLELGTGTGHGTAWLLSGMDAAATLDTVDNDAAVVAVARRHLANDRRVTFHVVDGAEFLEQSSPGGYDLIYADAWPGKFSHLDAALALLKRGRHLLHRRPAAAAELAGGPRTEGAGADRRDRAARRLRHRAAGVGLRIDAGRPRGVKA